MQHRQQLFKAEAIDASLLGLAFGVEPFRFVVSEEGPCGRPDGSVY
jgi:hypothetical protein